MGDLEDQNHHKPKQITMCLFFYPTSWDCLLLSGTSVWLLLHTTKKPKWSATAGGLFFWPHGSVTSYPKMQTSDSNHKSGGCFQAPHKCWSDNEVICYCRLQSGIQTALDCLVPPLDSPPFVSFCRRLYSFESKSNCLNLNMWSYIVKTLSKSCWRFFFTWNFKNESY